MGFQLIESGTWIYFFFADEKHNLYGATNTMYVTVQLRACAVVLIAEHCQLAIQLLWRPVVIKNASRDAIPN